KMMKKLLGSLRAHPPIVFLRYTLHAFYHAVNMLTHHPCLRGFFNFILFCLVLCTNEKTLWG
uniref:Uncharacterized protein n=1 Tax=Gopherus agassizii TaxID=38772 RepID=A0A452IAE2_9SAUR